MNRPIFDMNQCKPGDLLISKHGTKFEYITIMTELHPENPYVHLVYNLDNGGEGSRTNEGWTFQHISKPEDHDIIGFAKEYDARTRETSAFHRKMERK